MSDTLETAPVLACMLKAFEKYGDDYIRLLTEHGIRQSMDGKARWVNNVIISIGSEA